MTRQRLQNVDKRVAAVERARLRSSCKTIQPCATGTPQCLGLRPLRARSQPRVTRQRLQNVDDRRGSITDRETLTRVLGLLNFVEHRNGEVGKGDPAFAFSADQQVVLPQTESARALPLYKLG